VTEPKKVHVVGFSDDGLQGLTSAAHECLAKADIVIGEQALLAQLDSSRAETWDPQGDLEAVVNRIASESEREVVLLASGDPLFYGMARYLCERLGKERFEVLPHVSSMQMAFARVKESWDEAYLTNLASQTVDVVVERVRTAEKVGIFTTDEYSPGYVARTLLDRKIDYFTAYVCENLGSPDERVTFGELAEIAEQEFSELNVLILVRKPDVPDRPTAMVGRRLFGNPDEMFLQSQPKRGLLTPSEVRSVALAELDLGPNSVVWDVGAGSGSIAVEAAQIAEGGRVFAIEMDPEDHSLILSNAERFGTTNLTPVLGKAPEVWEDLPAPDAVFVGGTGRQVSQLAVHAFERLRPGGRLVVNVNSVENVTAVRDALRKEVQEVQAWMFSVSRGADQLEQLRFESLNPTFLLGAVKPA
jgi:precorrin-6Y C5,15-methyltransferase (decarboxylating)